MILKKKHLLSDKKDSQRSDKEIMTTKFTKTTKQVNIFKNDSN